ncbi:MAG: adenylyl-sulfate kinase [Acidobacteria bacterium]|nr:MAG: adenylyl-sulfate kinase [Acidobacteriota bacterium]
MKSPLRNPQSEIRNQSRDTLNIVVVGHVDHGKSTVIGRLMADTNTLPLGKLEQVKARCRQSARPFEYAFLLDALADEQAQGITIDSARCFFRTSRRDYIIIDAPGHLEFLKNMISGASRAEAALLVIDAHEGIRENSRRHGYMLSMLGIRQIVVLVNKMDLVGYDLGVFEGIRRDYAGFLADIGVTSIDFVPICARDGSNISTRAAWYSGLTVLEQIDSFSSEKGAQSGPLRFPVQDIYKFTEHGDDRRIVAGTVESGAIAVGDQVVLLPSGKSSRVKTVEGFGQPARDRAGAGEATGLTLSDDLYIRPGEIMCRIDDVPPLVASRLRVSLFWMGKAPMIRGKKYKLKLATCRVSVELREVIRVLNADDLCTQQKQQVDRHDVAECVLETAKPIAMDLIGDLPATARFVVVDHYEIAGGGTIFAAVSGSRSALCDHVARRESGWERSEISPETRAMRYRHRSKFIVVSGAPDASNAVAKALEKALFEEGYVAYYLGVSTIDHGLDADVIDSAEKREEGVRRMGELARILTDTGQILITALPDMDRHEMAQLRTLNAPNEILVVWVGDAVGNDCQPDVRLAVDAGRAEAVAHIMSHLRKEDIILDYSI